MDRAALKLSEDWSGEICLIRVLLGGCKIRRTIQSRYRGITFHKFPREKALRRQWELATRRKGVSASDCSMLCSEHFKPRDGDRTGQIVRIREGTKPSVFNFPAHLQRPVAPKKTRTSRRANPTDLKARLREALARVESLERDMRNVKKGEEGKEHDASSSRGPEWKELHKYRVETQAQFLLGENEHKKLNYMADEFHGCQAWR